MSPTVFVSSQEFITRLAILGIVGAVACGDGNAVAPPKPPTPPVATTYTIQLSRISLTLSPGESATLDATIHASTGESVPGQVVVWSSDDSLVATVSSAGKVTAVARGTTAVRARFGGATAAAPVVVGSLDLQAAIPWTGESAWAGTPFVTTPSVRVVRLASSIVSAGDNIGVPGVTIKFTVTAGGVVRDTTVVSDEFGLGSCGSWMLGAAPGENTVTATVDGVERSIVFTAFAQPRPTALASYRLDSQTPNSPYGHGGIVGGTLTLGDDGSFESGLDYYWAASESGFPVSATFWRLSTYSTSGSTIAFHDFFQSTGTVRGDSLIVTYLDEEFDPPQVIRQVYLRSK